MRTLPAIVQRVKFRPKSIIVSSPAITAKPSNYFTPTTDRSQFNTSGHLSSLKNHRIDEARELFNKIPFLDVYTCTKMMAGYVKTYRLYEALKLFDEMPHKDIAVWNLMIKGCIDCGELDMAANLFDEMPERNVISWTTMINGFLNSGRVELAESLFMEMPMKDIAVWNSMIHGYFGNDRIDKAMKLFEEMPHRNVISWTSMISGLDHHGRSSEAFFFFKQMVNSSSIRPTSNTFSCVITACGNVSDLISGIQIHGYLLKIGYFFDEFITASLITFYANCKKIDDSLKIFSDNSHKNVVVWTALLTGYGLNDEHEKGLKLFSNMLKIGLFPNQSSFTSALNSCCETGGFDQGKEIHSQAVKLGFENDVFVGNSLIVFYSKCGEIQDGIVIFNRIVDKNMVSWNSTIFGCAQHGLGMWALEIFNQIIRIGIEPDEITFNGLLSACSHSGLLIKGRGVFRYLCGFFPEILKIEHYSCMVDLLCRNGELEEAMDLIKTMPIKSNLAIWVSVLSGCRENSNLEMAERAAKAILDLDPHCSAGYILLSNLYAFANRWDDVSRIREKMKQIGIKKEPGFSSVMLKGLFGSDNERKSAFCFRI